MSIKLKDDSSKVNLNFKFLILGDSQIGKTSILERYVNDTFKENYLVTVGVDKRFKYLKVNGFDLDITLTDTAGQERFRSLSKMSYKNADGILVGFALNAPETLESVNYWIEQINNNTNKGGSVSLVLFGNKCDDEKNISVKKEKIDEISSKYGLKYFKTSAKLNINIKNIFEYLVKETIIKKGLLTKIGLNDNSNIDAIGIVEKEIQKPRYDSRAHNKRRKKRKFC
jgi:small GTP-binding protein